MRLPLRPMHGTIVLVTFPEPAMDTPRLAPALVEQLHDLNHVHWLRLLCFAVLYPLAASAAYYVAVDHGDEPWALVTRLPLYLLAAASLHGISLFTHEGVHGTLCRQPLLNRLIAAACAWPVLHNFAAYR